MWRRSSKYGTLTFFARPFHRHSPLILAAGETKFPLPFCHRVSFHAPLKFFALNSAFLYCVKLGRKKSPLSNFRGNLSIPWATLVLMNKPLLSQTPIPYLTFFIKAISHPRDRERNVRAKERVAKNDFPRFLLKSLEIHVWKVGG